MAESFEWKASVKNQVKVGDLHIHKFQNSEAFREKESYIF